jgi:hypothetical protein
MLPSPSSLRLVLENRTNLSYTTLQPSKALLKFPTPPKDSKVKRRTTVFDDGPKKRPRLDFERGISGNIYESDDSDVEMEDIAVAQARTRKVTPFQRNIMSTMRPLGNFRQLNSKHFQSQKFYIQFCLLTLSSE